MHRNIYFLCLHLCFLVTLGTITMVANAAEEPFLGEVRWFAGNFAPRGWAFCDGQLLPIAENTALFSLLGTIYGGDGRTTFALPDMRGRGMIHEGAGLGLSSRVLGEKSGTESHILIANQIPSHQHKLRGDSSGGDSVLPNDRVVSKVGRLRIFNSAPDVNMGNSSIAAEGGGQSHNNVQPNIALTCIIATQGVYPSRS
jgi:microcystin-dependent protein